MLGFIHISFEAFVRARFGDPLWLQLVTEARCSAPVNSFFTFLDLQAHHKAAAVPHGWISCAHHTVRAVARRLDFPSSAVLAPTLTGI